MKVIQTAISDVFVVDTDVFIDSRGGFGRFFCAEDLRLLLGERRIVQINHSFTVNAGAIRGMHFQRPPHAERKFVRCLKGKVWDVAVDLRPNSPTYLRWHAEELSAENRRMMVIPEGCAHGFQAQVECSELLYLHTDYYSPDDEGGVRYDDPALKIQWPLPATDISSRDMSHPLIGKDFLGINI